MRIRKAINIMNAIMVPIVRAYSDLKLLAQSNTTDDKLTITIQMSSASITVIYILLFFNTNSDNSKYYLNKSATFRS